MELCPIDFVHSQQEQFLSSIVMWETLQKNADWVHFKILILLERHLVHVQESNVRTILLDVQEANCSLTQFH